MITRPGLAGVPQWPVEVPAPIHALAAGEPITPVWQNGLGGLTFRIGGRFAKWVPRNTEIDLADECSRVDWAAGRHPVPRVLGFGEDEYAQWLVTAALPGESAVSGHWLGRPADAVAAIGRGLRRLHDALSPAECPFEWSVERRIGRLGPDVAARIGPPPPIDRLVVCHGDACAPNTLIAPDGRFAGHVDLGELGVADRWADLSVASMSLGWNYGDRFERGFFEAYGVERDEARISYYRALWNADGPATPHTD